MSCGSQVIEFSLRMTIYIQLTIVSTKLIEFQFPNFSKSPDRPSNPQILFVRIVRRIGGGQLGLSFHSPNGQITELEYFGELYVDNGQPCPFLQILVAPSA